MSTNPVFVKFHIHSYQLTIGVKKIQVHKATQIVEVY